MKIKFVIDKYRKDNGDSNFNPKLSKYWATQFYDLFRGWDDK